MEIPFIEMFSGIGGFRLGLEKANQISINSQQRTGNEEGRDFSCLERSDGRFKQGFRCVWANDWDKHACQVYRKNFGDKELVEADIRTIDANTIPDHVLLTAGFPCQSFSLAGKRKGFEDTRGTLFYDVARVAKAKRPKLLLLENVKGILSNDRGRTFAKILQTLDELGYNVEWQVLNSKHFGVPQNRERVFIVGHSRAEPTKQIFPIVETNREFVETCGKTQGERKRFPTANTLSSRYYKNGSENLIYDGHHHQFTPKMGTLTERENRQGTNWLVLVAHTKANIRRRQQNRDSTWTLDGTKGKMAIAQALQTDEFLRQGTSWGTKNPQSHRNIRRLTPVECERLQGFPDGWTQFGIVYSQKESSSSQTASIVEISDTQRYKMLGNAVTVNVVAYLGKLLLPILSFAEALTGA